MNCFKELVNSKFIANALTEILVAKKRLISDVHMPGNTNTHSFIAADKKQTYYFAGNELGFFYKLYQLNITAHRIYYMQYEHYLMIASSSKKLLNTAMISSLNVNGDCPIYRATHILNKRRIHTALYNTSFNLLPVTLN